MRDYKYILFDLDGTLTDPKEGITKSVAYALKHFGIDVEDLDTLCKFIGPPLKDSFMQYYGLSEDDAHLAVEKYREYFEPCGMFQNKVYDGVENLLKELKTSGKEIVLATSKPGVYAQKILEHFHLDSYFSYVAGSELDGRRVKKRRCDRICIREDEYKRIFTGGHDRRSGSMILSERKSMDFPASVYFMDMEAEKNLNGMGQIALWRR